LVIERLSSLQCNDTSGEEFSLWLSRFEELLTKHFMTEEQLMRQLGVDRPELELVEKDHNRLLGMQVAIVESMMHGNHRALSQVASELASAISTHIAKHDSKYFP
jgi:hemerythrin